MQKVIRHRDKLFTTTIPTRVLYTYKYPQTWFSDYPGVEFVKQIPQNLNPNIPSLVVLDDLICDNTLLKECASLFVRGSHHLNASVFFITQNLFVNVCDFRTISLNANQFVLFKTVRGINQIEHLARQIYNKNETRQFMNAYKDATRDAYSYLLLDLEPTQHFRLRSHIFPNEEEYIYVLE